MTATVHLIAPEDFDDLGRPSGGNHYDRQLASGLADLGWQVSPHRVPGRWPWPDAIELDRLNRVLAAIPDGSLVLVDGLIGSTLPDVVVPVARRLRLAMLVHMPLGGAPLGHEVNDADTLEATVLAAVAAVVTVSAWSRDTLLKRYRLAPERVHVALPGTDPADLAAPTPAGDRLVCVAAVTRHKGHDTLVDALDRIAHLRWRCSCVGPLDREPEFVASVRRRLGVSPIADRVTLAGQRIGPELAETYGATDLAVLASRVESYGMVVTEALSRGIPVVASSVGGVPEAVGTLPDGRRPGLLVQPDEPAALAAALTDWLSDARMRSDLRRAARERRTALPGWASTARRVDAVLKEISS